MRQAVTQWFANGEHHHVEFGHVDADAPEIRFPSQRGWPKLAWTKRLWWMEDGKLRPVEVPS